MCKYILKYLHLSFSIFSYFISSYVLLEMRVARKTAQPLTLKSGRRGPLQGEWSKRALARRRIFSPKFYNFRGGLKLPKFDVHPPRVRNRSLKQAEKHNV